MNCHKLAKTIRVPFKSCHNAVISHNSVSLRLNIEWPEGQGDSPNLLIEFTDETLSTRFNPNETTLVFAPESDPVRSAVSHSFPTDLLHQIGRHPPIYTSFTSSNHTMNSSGARTNQPNDHNDVSSTTPTQTGALVPVHLGFVKRTSSVPQDFDVHAFSNGTPQHPTPNPSYPSPQEIPRLPSNSVDDPQTTASISTMSPSSFITRSISDAPSNATGMYQSSTSSCEHLGPVVCTCSAPIHSHQHCCPARIYRDGSPNSGSPLEIAQRTPSNPLAPQAFVFTDASGLCPTKPLSPPKGQVPMPFRNSTPSHPLVMQPAIPAFVGNSVLHAPFHCSHTHPMHQNRLPTSAPLNINGPQLSFDFPVIPGPDDFSQPVSRASESTKARLKDVVSASSQSQGQHSSKQNSPTMATNVDQSTPRQSMDESFAQHQQSMPPTSHPLPIAQKGIVPRLLASPVHSPPNTQTRHQESPPVLSPTNRIATTSALSTSPNDARTHSAPQTPSLVRTRVRSPVTLDDSLQPAETAPPAGTASTVERMIEDVARGSETPRCPQHVAPIPPPKRSRGRPPGRMNNPRPSFLGQRPPMVMPPSFSNPSGIRQVLCNPSGPPMNIKRKRKPYGPRSKDSHFARGLDREAFNFAPGTNVDGSSVQRKHFQTFARSSNTVSTPFTGGAMTIATGHAPQPFFFPKDGTWPPAPVDHLTNLFTNFNPGVTVNQVETTPMNIGYGYDFTDELLHCQDTRFDASTPPPPSNPNVRFQPSFDNSLMQTTPSMMRMAPSTGDLYADLLPHLSKTSPENQVTSSVSTPPDPQSLQMSQLPTVPPSSSYYSQLPDFSSLTQTSISVSIGTTSNSFDQMRNKDQQSLRANAGQLSTPMKKSSHLIAGPRKLPKGPSSSPSCSNCGATKLIDITAQEFSDQTGLVFECVSCGNNSMRSNISAEERRRRLNRVADDHLNAVQCQFCPQRCSNRNEYTVHLQNDHGSNKPQ